MKAIIRVLIAISVLGFVLSVISTLLGGSLFGVHAPAYSKTCNNLALIAIALTLSFRESNS